VTLALIVPMKSPSRAKQRLDGILTEPERWRLARTMAVDVLEVVARVPGVRPFAVSDDPALRALAGRLGITAVIDRERAGQTAAVRQGFRAAAASGNEPLATIPGDVPAVTVAELVDLCQAQPDIDVLLAPDRDGIGTNGLRLRSPDAIALHFGDDSLRQHREEAVRAGLTFEVLPLERLACDLDRPEDLVAFLRLAPPTATLALLQELQVQDRLGAGDRPRG
jgi:2-phospho-L-lactate/phosphoenolpyruvate guanylyltransferase